MKEILGNNLKEFFNAIDNAHSDAHTSYKGNKYEVWEVSDELHKKMCDMSEEEFVELAGDDAWLRSANGSNLGIPKEEFTINGEKMLGWNWNNTN